MRIKKGADPIGTNHLVRMQSAALMTWHKYEVVAVTDAATNMPNEKDPVVFFELAEKNPGHLQQFFSLPLSAFPNRVVPNAESDKFWEEQKGADFVPFQL